MDKDVDIGDLLTRDEVEHIKNHQKRCIHFCGHLYIFHEYKQWVDGIGEGERCTIDGCDCKYN